MKPWLPKTIAILLGLSMYAPGASAEDAAPTSQPDKRREYSPSQLGIILQKHPNEPQYDFTKPDDSREPITLQGSISTKITAVEFDEAGSYTVQVASGLSIIDKKRKKRIPLEVAYPQQAGNYPIIIFSHASITSGRDYRPLAAYWASHGYVSVMPTHEDALTLHVKPGQNVSVFKLAKLSRVNDEKLENRAKDLGTVLDSIAKLPEKIEGLNGKLNKEKIAVIGHHSGATACQLISGVKYKNGKRELSTDPRIDAAIYFMGINWRLPDPEKLDWSDNKIPVLMVSFSNPVKDVSKLREKTRSSMAESREGKVYFTTIDSTREKKPSRRQIRKMIKSSNIKLITWRPLKRFRNREDNPPGKATSDLKISDADHAEMPGNQIMKILGVSPINEPADSTERFKFAMSATIPFLNAYLKDDKKELEYLKSGAEKRYADDVIVKTKPLSLLQP